MTDPAVLCPKCGSEIRLTESLAAPLIAATRREFDSQQNAWISTMAMLSIFQFYYERQSR